MGKTLQLTRNELVWQTRCNSWDETDYKKYVEWLKGFEHSDQRWGRYNYAIYNVISAYTWDEIVNMIEHRDYDNEPKVQFYAEDDDYISSESIVDIIKDAIREDNYNCNILDEEYADDFNEQWGVKANDEQR